MHRVMYQEAGPEFDKLGKWLWDIAERVTPLVEAITQLRLPEPVVIRLMTVDDWTKAHKESSQDWLYAEAKQLGIDPMAMLRARHNRLTILQERALHWPLMVGEAVELVPGSPELVIVPEALRHAGWLADGPVLHKLLAHAMTHLAQYATDRGAMWADQESFFPVQRGVADRDHGFLLEGHACWADRKITAEVFGEPVTIDEISPDASEDWRQLASRSVPANTEVLARSTDAVAQLIAMQDVEGFNRVWYDRALVPTRAEALEPALWIKRLVAVR